VRIWLYAGNPEYPALLADEVGSDNASGADNQQERPADLAGILRDHTPDIQSLDDEMVPSAWRHAGERHPQGVPVPFDMTNETCLNKTISEIPCRVIKLPESGVILANKPANNGEALLVRDAFKDVVTAKG
jgi:hypothetical protein